MVNVKKIEVVDGVRWVELTGTDYGTGKEFENEVYGIGINDDRLLFDDGTGIECESDWLAIAIRNSIK